MASTTWPRRRLDQPELGSHRAQDRRPGARAQPGERGAQQQQPAGALVVREAGLDRHPAAHAVAGDVRALDAERVHGGEHRAREPGRVVGCADRLVGLAEAGQVERHDPVAVGQRGHRREERRLRPAEAVQAHDRLAPGPGGEHRDRAEPARADGVELEPAALVGAARGRQEADAQVQAAANPEPARLGTPPSHRARRRRYAARWRRPRSGRSRDRRPSSASRSRRRRPAITASHAAPPVTARRTRARPPGTCMASASKRSASDAIAVSRCRVPLPGGGCHQRSIPPEGSAQPLRRD